MLATKRLSSGKYIDLVTLSASDINIQDITTSLNYIFRFTGHHKNRPPLTVAQHTVLCTQLAKIIFPNEKEVEFDCLLHDMPESYISDVASPLKKVFGQSFKDFEEQIENVVYDALWVIDTPFSESIKSKRKVCDLLSLDIERRAMWDDQKGKSNWPAIPNEGLISLSTKIQMFDDVQATRFHDLTSIYRTLVDEIRSIE